MKFPSARSMLAIETATAWQSVALMQDERVLALAEQDADGSHARSLMGAIDRVLRESGFHIRDVQHLAVSIGPGSFTGLRVGLATMLGFRAVLGTAIVPVPTLEAMAWNLRGRQGLLVPVLKSRHNRSLLGRLRVAAGFNPSYPNCRAGGTSRYRRAGATRRRDCDVVWRWVAGLWG